MIRSGHTAAAVSALAGQGKMSAQVNAAMNANPAAFAAMSANPAAFLGLNDRLGHLKPGYRADVVAFEPEQMRVLATWVAGSLGPPHLRCLESDRRAS